MRPTFPLRWILLGVAVFGWLLAVSFRPHSAVIALDALVVLWIANSKLGISARCGWTPPKVPYFLGVGIIAIALFLTTLLFPIL